MRKGDRRAYAFYAAYGFLLYGKDDDQFRCHVFEGCLRADTCLLSGAGDHDHNLCGYSLDFWTVESV